MSRETKSRKSKIRIDYKELHLTGEKVEKPIEDLVSSLKDLKMTDHEDPSEKIDAVLKTNQKLHIMPAELDNTSQKLYIQIQSLADDIDDFIEENSIEEIEDSMSDLDLVIKRIEEMRSQYRAKHKELSALDPRYGDNQDYTDRLLLMKKYMFTGKDARQRVRRMEESGKQDEKEVKRAAFSFIIDDARRMIVNLKAEMTVPDEMNVKELSRKRKDLSSIDQRVENLGTKFTEALAYSSTSREDELRKKLFQQEYADVLTRKMNYTKKINEECDKKELDKEEKFKESTLSIKLQKFKGYGSSTDIYTFQRDFEKIYSRTYPKRTQPDLLKNNFLGEAALSLVKSLDDIDEIWTRLKRAFGDPKVMLERKFEEINKITALTKSKDPEKNMESIQSIINLMKDLVDLSTQHNIENDLYHGDAFERIVKLLGEARTTRWISSICTGEAVEKSNPEKWQSLTDFLEKESKILLQKMLLFKKSDKSKETKNEDRIKVDEKKSNYHNDAHNAESKDDNLICSICNQAGHVATMGPNYKQVIQYFTCKKFVDMTPAQRFTAVKGKGLCYQCLLPGADATKGKHFEGKCQRDFVCKHANHNTFKRKMHVLLCEAHKDSEENRKLLEVYKSRCILVKEKRVQLPNFSKEIKLSFHSGAALPASGDSSCCLAEEENEEKAVYLLQTIMVNGNCFTIFYDNGCGGFMSRYQAVTRLGDKATQERSGSIQIGGVGGIVTQSNHGVYSVKIPLHNDDEAKLVGPCLDQITEEFPRYPLKGTVEDEMKDAYSKVGGDINKLPQLPSYIGGHVDFMIGVKYLRYFPEKIFQMPSGLTIYESKFTNAGGGRGIIGGPHEVFTQIDKKFYMDSNLTKTFLCNQAALFNMGYQVNPDVRLSGYDDVLNLNLEFNNILAHRSGAEKRFEAVEEAGTLINYRCVDCRSCKSCRNGEHTEAISIREEMEEDLISKSVEVDFNNKTSISKLPLIYDPLKLAPNKHKALKVYDQQLKKLDRNPKDKADVLNSEMKLQALGYVDYVRNLSCDQQKMLKSTQIQNFIPWRAVWKEDSLSTPCRVVFDASQPTDSGYSLNDILAKGRNNLNKLQEILLRWSSYKIGFHTDISKMYNCVKLKEDHWCLQRYIWQENLDSSQIPEEKVIKTNIYGVKSSGNIVETCVRKTGSLSKEEYPEADEIIQNDFYVDDGYSGASSTDEAYRKADDLEVVLSRGGFSLKGVAFSGEPPPDSMSDDGESMILAGFRWFTESDTISLNLKDLVFSKKQRGKRPAAAEVNIIPSKLTRRHCVAKVAEIYDLLGKFTPLTAEMKLDLHELVTRKLQWDDVIPDNLRAVWESHFQMMQEMRNIRFNRAIIPTDAVDLNIDTLDFGDASQRLLCVAIYARFRRSNGEYSCQLVLARSRLVPDGMSQPRAELYAALINAYSGEIVKRAFYKIHRSSIKFTDSQIALHWIDNEEKPLKQWVRNRVIEIRRFTQRESWKYIESEQMIADLGTRRGAKLDDVDQNSQWINGYDWMKRDPDTFPAKSAKEVILINEEMQEVKKESLLDEREIVHLNRTSKKVPVDVMERYHYSSYLIDPNHRNFQMVVRIMAIVIKFVKILKQRVKKLNPCISPDVSIIQRPLLNAEDILAAETYFFKIATSEIKHFYKRESYLKYSKEVDGVLKYTGRILPTDQVQAVGAMTEVMKDLSSTTFCVPVIDKHSPIAYSIVSDVHWNDDLVKHRGIEVTLRQILKYVYIHEGRELVKRIKKNCERCRFLERKTIDVVMGPLSQHHINIAPAFYTSQVDLAGPFKCYSNVNKRATVKIWLTIFCCAATVTTSIKVMEDYSSPAFIQAFIRFSCEFGYPKLLVIDGGSQLVSTSDNIKLNFTDLQNKLHRDMSVDSEVVPVGGHNMNGRVERKIQEVRRSLERSLQNERLSLLQWETLSAEIANRINDLPLALGNIKGDFDTMDLITPNRLRLGRNNNRSPAGSLTITTNPLKIIAENQRIFNTWFENWLLSHVPKLMTQPKWFKMEEHIKEGDIVLFQKNDSVLSVTYQYGMVKSVEVGKDGIVRKVQIKYRNHNENIDRETYRSVRQLVMIHRLDELDVIEELAEMAKYADVGKQRFDSRMRGSVESAIRPSKVNHVTICTNKTIVSPINSNDY